MRRLILINSLILLVGLIVVELVFGTWLKPDRGALFDFLQPRNVHLRFQVDFPDYKADVHYTRDAFGLRGVDGAYANIELVTVGGSTTDQRYVTDSYTWQEVMQRLLKEHGRDIDIVNAGIDGQSLYGHIRNFDYWFPRIPDFRPKYILFYVGINDFYNLESRKGFDDLNATSLSDRVVGYIREHSAIFGALKILKSVLQPNLAPGHHQINFADHPYTEATPIHERYDHQPMQQSIADLRTSLREVMNRSREMGAEPILVTQRTAKWQYTEHEGSVRGVGPEDPPRYSAALTPLERINGIDIFNLEKMQRAAIMDECSLANAICIDLGSDLELLPGRDVYDWAHTTDQGSNRIAEYLYAALKARI